MAGEVVTLDALNHRIGKEQDKTVCGLQIPPGTGELEGTNPCPECFPTVAKSTSRRKKAA